MSGICYGQDSIKFGGLDVDSIVINGSTAWIKNTTDIIDCTYEGIITVGDSDEYPYLYSIGYYGFSWPGDAERTPFGSLSPVNNAVQSILFIPSTSRFIFLMKDVIDVSALTINSVVYNDINWQTTDYGDYIQGSFELTDASNPFPEVGQTCNIKLKYTIP